MDLRKKEKVIKLSGRGFVARGDFTILALYSHRPFIGVVKARPWRVAFERTIYHYLDNRAKIRRSAPRLGAVFAAGVVGMIYHFLDASARLINVSPMPFQRYVSTVAVAALKGAARKCQQSM